VTGIDAEALINPEKIKLTHNNPNPVHQAIESFTHNLLLHQFL